MTCNIIRYSVNIYYRLLLHTSHTLLAVITNLKLYIDFSQNH